MLLGLTAGTDFKCVDRAGAPLNFCFGVGANNHALFQQLQQAANRLTNLGGFQSLTVDGFIGPATVDAVRKVLFIGPVGSLPWTKETISSNASDVIEGLDSLASDLQARGETLGPEGAPVQPTVQTMVASTGIPQENAADIIAAALGPTTPNKKTKLLPWIIGGVAAIAIVGVGGYFYHRRKAGQQLVNWSDDDLDGDDSEFEGDNDASFEGEGDEP